MRIHVSRKEEIEDCLEDLLIDMLDESCPLLSKEDRKKLAKERRGWAFDYISSQLEGYEKDLAEKDREIDSYETRVKELKDHASSLENELSDSHDEKRELQEQIDDLELRINNPTEWLGRKFGI